MPDLRSTITKLARDLMPRGRAFKMPAGGALEQLQRALAASENTAYNAALSTLDSAIADNANFTADDAADWERRLGIISSGTSTALATRMAAINQKLNYPGSAAPRQHWHYIQDQLQAAGFNVNIYENNFSGLAKTPEQILGTSGGAVLHSTTVRHKNTTRHGSVYSNKIVNYLEESKDADFVIGANYRFSFYVAGSTVGTFATVPLARKNEFRQLLLMLKPAHMAGFLFINYT